MSTISADIERNGISAEGATEVARALEANTTLAEVNLVGNGIGAEGAAQGGLCPRGLHDPRTAKY